MSEFISLVDADRIFPNLALMKLSAYHKSRNDKVYLNYPFGKYDTVYASCVFTWNASKLKRLLYSFHDSDNIIIGGSGYDLKTKLPLEIEHITPDYSLYNIKFGVGFISRGCVRKCPFCIVSEKEGSLRQVADIEDCLNPLSNVVVFLDNNFLGLPNCVELLEKMKKMNLIVDFNQGLDIRLINEDKAKALSKIKPVKFWRFALDSNEVIDKFKEKMEIVTKYISPGLVLSCILVGFNTGWKEDLERIITIKDSKTGAFFMIFRGKNGEFGSYNKEKITDKETIKEILGIRTPRGNVIRYIRLFNPDFDYNEFKP